MLLFVDYFVVVVDWILEDLVEGFVGNFVV